MTPTHMYYLMYSQREKMWYFHLGEGKTALGRRWGTARKRLEEAGIRTNHPDRKTCRRYPYGQEITGSR